MKPIFSPWYSSARYHYIATMFPLNSRVVPPFRTQPTTPWFDRVKRQHLNIFTLDKLRYQTSWKKSKNNFLVLHFPTYTQHSFFRQDFCRSGTGPPNLSNKNYPTVALSKLVNSKIWFEWESKQEPSLSSTNILFWPARYGGLLGLVSSTPTEQHDADGPDFDSVLHKVLYCVILKQFHQHFNKKM